MCVCAAWRHKRSSLCSKNVDASRQHTHTTSNKSPVSVSAYFISVPTVSVFFFISPFSVVLSLNSPQHDLQINSGSVALCLFFSHIVRFELNPQQSPCLATSLVCFRPEQCQVEVKPENWKVVAEFKTFCFSLSGKFNFNLTSNYLDEPASLPQRLSSAVLVFSLLFFFDAFMFHPSGVDTRPGADGLTN